MSLLEPRPVSEAHEERLKPYVPRLLIEWQREQTTSRHLGLEGSLVFVDISGFTALTERLARRGKIGAELMRDTLDGVFTALLDEAYDWGAGLLKWGGDALLLLFDGDLHAERATRAAWEMQRTIERVGRVRVAGGSVTLRMSIGLSTGTFDFFRAGSVHRELLIAGHRTTETVVMEGIADAGEIAISPALAAVLDPACVGAPKEEALLLARPPEVERARAPDVGSVRGLDIASCIPIAARAHVLLESSVPEHRTITAAFIDLMDTDRLLAQLGPAEFAAALDARLCAIQEAALQFDVPFYETDVGKSSVKALLTAGAPSSTGHDEERMLRALREIVESPGVIPLRIGVNTGKVFTGDFGPPYRRAYRVFGDAINTAARVMSKADPGQVLSTEIVLDRSRTTFETSPIEPFAAKGKAAPIRASVVGPVAGVKADRRVDVRLTGRDAELAELLQVLNDVRSGRGWIVEIGGEAGIGKSRLVAELIERSRDMVVLHSRCEEYESATPYFAFRSPMRAVLGIGSETDTTAVEERLRQAVGRVDPTLLPWLPLIGILLGLDLPHTAETRQLDGQFLRERLAEVVMRFLASSLAGTPTMLVVEDTHFIDEASTDLLTRLSRAGSDLRQVLVVTHARPTAVWAPFDDDLRCLALALLPLTTQATVEILERLTDDDPLAPHVVDELARRSGGNPLFLLELLEGARRTGSVEALPDSVESLIAGEIDRLAPEDRTVLRYAAVLGATFEPERLEQAAQHEVDLDPDTWARLAELVDAGPAGSMRFRNTLVRDAAYEGLPYRRRRELHARVGEAIEATAGESLEEELGTLALHFHEAQRFEKAWEYCSRAGARALEIYANVEAVRFYERAISAGRRLRQVASSDVAAATEALGDAHYRLGDFSRAAVAYRKARSTLGRDAAGASRIIVKEAKLHERQGRYPAALRMFRRGVNALAGDDSPEAEAYRAELYAWYGGVRLRQNRHRDAIAWCLLAEEAARTSGALEPLAKAYVVHDIARFILGDTRMEHHPEALAIYEQVGNVREQGNVLSNMGNAAYEVSDWTTSLELYNRARGLLVAIGDRWNESFATYNIGEILSDQGRYDEAEPLLREALRIWRASGARSEVAHATRQLGRLNARRGSFVDARRLLDAARTEQLLSGQPAEIVETDARIAECLVYAGAAAAALGLCDETLARADATEGAGGNVPTLTRIRGWALLLLGRDEEAADVLGEALAAARARTAELEAAFALEGLAELERRAGGGAAALEDERQAILTALGVVRTPKLPAAAAAAAEPVAIA